MKKNIKILYILLLVCTVILPFKVKAAIESDYNITTGNFSNGGGGGSSNTYKGSYPNFQLKGVRITLVDNNGDKIGKTINFFCNKDASLDWTNVNYVAGNKTIKEIKASDNVDIEESKRIASIPGGINTDFDDQLCTSNLDWTAFSNRIIELSNGINNENTDSYEFFQKFGKSFDEEEVLNWYYMIEPIIVIGVDHNGLRVCTAWGTSAEFAKYRDALLPCSADNNNAHKTWLEWSKNAYIKYNRSDNGVTYFGTGNISSSFTDKFSNGNYVGLVWLGKNANPKKACPSGTEKSGQQLLPSTCNTACSTSGYDSNNCCDKACKLSEVSCSSFQNRSNTWTEGWVYSTSKADKKLSANASTKTIKETCGDQYTCDTPEIYNSKTNFKNVNLTSNTTKNCCIEFENKYSSNSQKLNELYRDHPECYTCKYDETKINPTCSTGNNKKTTGYTFTRDVGIATVTADTYTCISKSANGESENVSRNLFTKKVINQYCKVICSETVTLEFPFFNNGNSVRYVTKNSIFAWPKKNNSDEDELKLKASGKLTCWYHVNLVKLYNLFGSDKNGAVESFNQCKDDMNNSLTTPENILPETNSYNLSGSFKVKTDDDSGYVSLAKENGTNSVSYTKQTSSTKITLPATKDNVSSLARAAEKLKFEVTENANFVISNTGENAGYSYSYDGKYYRSKTDVGISNIKSNNIIKFEPSLKFNEKTGSGNVSIIYSNIGGSSPKFIKSEQTYENKDGSGLKNNRCVYKKINNGKEYLCPDGTKNKGMNLKNYMTTESLTYDEAVEKYCNENDMTVCPSDSYYPNKAITKTCYNDENCLKLTCYRYTCTDDDGCHELNDCIEKTIKDYNMSFDEAKKVCTKNNCNEKVNNSGNIEYRVIDLKDPFPGNAAKAGSSLFNTNIKGRKPGSNWNSTTVVQKEILKNRGVNNDAIYGLEPLYVFELTPKVIDEIRKYNDKHSYDDFTLSCKGENKQACVASGFDFKTKFGIVKVIEQCKGISDLSKFNSCYNNDSLR